MSPSFLFLSHDNKLGDAVVLTGVFAPIRKRWPQAKIGVLCGSSNAFIYQAHPDVNHVHIAGSRSLLARLTAAWSTRTQRYQTLVHFGFDVDSRSLRMLVRATGIKACTLFTAPQRALCAQQEVFFGDWLHLHSSARHQRFLESLGIAGPSYNYDLKLSPQAVHQAQQWLAQAPTDTDQPLLVIACDASTTDRSFELPWLRKVCEQWLASHAGGRIALLCSNAQRHAELSTALQSLGTQTSTVRVAPLSPDAGFAIALIQQASIVLAPDTFAVHAASAFNIPVVALYPGDAHTVITWAPISKHHIQMVAGEGQPLNAHEPAQVVQQCDALLASATIPPPSSQAP